MQNDTLTSIFGRLTHPCILNNVPQYHHSQCNYVEIEIILIECEPTMGTPVVNVLQPVVL